MEVDEVENELLNRFDCMQTLDKEDLISQMMRLVGGSGLTKESASFYLEMNAWNVQSAVCAYFDLEAGSQAKQNLPKMTFIKDVTIGEGESVPPDTTFTKTWCVQNSGSDAWPQDAVLVFTSGTQMAQSQKIPVNRCLLPWQRMDLSVEMRSPREPGIYEAKYRMSTASGSFFGDSIWVIITVEPAGTLALTQQLNSFTAFGSKSEGQGQSGQGQANDQGHFPFGSPPANQGGSGVASRNIFGPRADGPQGQGHGQGGGGQNEDEAMN